MPTDEATGNEYYENQYPDLREKMNNKNRKQWGEKKIAFCPECHSEPCACEDNI